METAAQSIIKSQSCRKQNSAGPLEIPISTEQISKRAPPLACRILCARRSSRREDKGTPAEFYVGKFPSNLSEGVYNRHAGESRRPQKSVLDIPRRAPQISEPGRILRANAKTRQAESNAGVRIQREITRRYTREGRRLISARADAKNIRRHFLSPKQPCHGPGRSQETGPTTMEEIKVP